MCIQYTFCSESRQFKDAMQKKKKKTLYAKHLMKDCIYALEQKTHVLKESPMVFLLN